MPRKTKKKKVTRRTTRKKKMVVTKATRLRKAGLRGKYTSLVKLIPDLQSINFNVLDKDIIEVRTKKDAASAKTMKEALEWILIAMIRRESD